MSVLTHPLFFEKHTPTLFYKTITLFLKKPSTLFVRMVNPLYEFNRPSLQKRIMLGILKNLPLNTNHGDRGKKRKLNYRCIVIDITSMPSRWKHN